MCLTGPLHQNFNCGQCFSFQKFEESPSSGGDITDLVGNTIFRDSGQRIPSSGKRIGTGIGNRFRYRFRSSAELVEFKNTDRPVPDYCACLREEVRTAAFLQKSATGDPVALPAYEALKLATVNGARALGYAEGELGVVREGALADLIVVDLQKPHLQPVHDLVSNIVYCGKASDVDTVMVDGRIVVENRRVAGVDLPALYAAVAAAVKRITAK